MLFWWKIRPREQVSDLAGDNTGEDKDLNELNAVLEEACQELGWDFTATDKLSDVKIEKNDEFDKTQFC